MNPKRLGKQIHSDDGKRGLVIEFHFQAVCGAWAIRTGTNVQAKVQVTSG